MQTMRISDFEFNRMRLLKAIRREEPVARTDLVKLTGLAAGTVTQLTAELVKRKILIEGKPAKKSFGRPRVELQINPRAAYVVSVFSVPYEGYAIEIVDLKGAVVFGRKVRIARPRLLAGWAPRIAKAIDTTLKAAAVSRADISRIGILIHGIVDNQKGIVHWLATFPDRDVPLAALIERQLKIPVVIDNGNNLIARAEHWFGDSTEQLDDFSLIVIDRGLASAHYVDGNLWSGGQGINSELGHVKIMPLGDRQCYCGAYGCLASHCSMFGIISEVSERCGEPFPELESLTERFREIVLRAKRSDGLEREAFKTAGTLLGTAAANILHDRNPRRIIVMAFDADFITLISDAFFAQLKLHALPAFAANSTVHFKHINEADFYRKGCAALALEQIYMGGA